jgi:hypothetical protein
VSALILRRNRFGFWGNRPAGAQAPYAAGVGFQDQKLDA